MFIYSANSTASQSTKRNLTIFNRVTAESSEVLMECLTNCSRCAPYHAVDLYSWKVCQHVWRGRPGWLYVRVFLNIHSSDRQDYSLENEHLKKKEWENPLCLLSRVGVVVHDSWNRGDAHECCLWAWPVASNVCFYRMHTKDVCQIPLKWGSDGTCKTAGMHMTAVFVHKATW